MVDYGELRRKFKPKNRELEESKRKSREAVKRIAREFERKRQEAGLKEPDFRRTPIYYAVVVLLMVFLAIAFIGLSSGELRLGKKRVSKAAIQARQSIDALSVALGRYRFHCGAYPSDAEGLEALAAITPQKRGWFGPYVRKVVPDPWGEAYQYWTREDGEVPVLLSKGPDRKLGTGDDVLPDPQKFLEPFRDTTWTNHWVPYNLRGIVVAPNEQVREALREEVKKY